MTTANSHPTSLRLIWRVKRLKSRRMDAFAEGWDELLARLWGSNPMISSSFMDNLLRHFGSGREYLCIGFDGENRPQAMAIVERTGVGRWRSFLPSQAQVGPTLARRIEDISGLLTALPGHALQLDLLCNDSRYGDLRSCTPTPNSTWHALTTTVDLRGSFEEYWASRSSQLRKNLGRYRRKMAESGVPQFSSITCPKEIGDAVERYGALEAAGWKGRVGTALFPGSAKLAFYKDLLQKFACTSGAAVYELRIDGQLIASRLAVVDSEMLVILKTTYSERHASLSPGQVLLYYVVSQGFCEHPNKRIEFYTNASREQEAWSTSIRPIVHITVTRYPHWREFVAGQRSLGSRIKSSFRGSLIRADAVSALSADRYKAFEALPADVLHLFNEAERRYGVQASVDWFRNLCATVPSLGENASIEVLRRGDVPVAVLPLVRHSTRTRKMALRALGNFYTSIYAPPLERNLSIDELAFMLRAAIQAAGGATELEFGPMDPHSREFTVLRAAMTSCGLVVLPNFYFGNWSLPRPESISAYMESRPGSLRSTLRRRGRRFAAAGGTIEILSSKKDVARGLRAYEEVYGASWKQPEPFPQFIPGLMRFAADRGWLRLGIAWLGERPIAAQLWIVGCGRAEIFKLAYNEQYRSYSAGTILSAALLNDVLIDPTITIVDYLSGDDAYKRDWMGERAERWGLSGYDPASLPGSIEIIRKVFGRLRSRVPST